VAAGGGAVEVRAPRVILAASALQTPVILTRSRIAGGPVGRRLRAHPGAGVLGRFADPVRCWEGATQGHEVIGWRSRGIKLEALGQHPGVLVGRLPGVGTALAREAARVDRYASVGVALKARTEGTVRAGFDGDPVVRWDLVDDDVRTLASGIALAGRVLLAAGAEEVLPGVRGFDERVSDPRRLDALEADPPRDPAAYGMVATHLFGTCRASSDPARGVVRPDLRHHAVDGLWVVDSSVFPSNTGVNPQTSILAIATLAARRLAA
jgi:choline dehydrogenase-like flavoprotein